MASGIYDLDESLSKVTLLRMVFDLRLDVVALKDLLNKHGTIDSLELDAAKKYHASTPEFKQMSEYLGQIESQIRRYKADPQAHLKDIFNAKLRGQL